MLRVKKKALYILYIARPEYPVLLGIKLFSRARHWPGFLGAVRSAQKPCSDQSYTWSVLPTPRHTFTRT